MRVSRFLAVCFVACGTAAAEVRADDAALKGLKTDIEFAKAGDVSLTLDAFVPEGPGPFPTCILVHGGGFVCGVKQSYIKTLGEPLSEAS